MSTTQTLPAPSTTWAQRKNCIFLTICLEDCKDPTVKIEPNSIYFRGFGGTDNKEHEVTIDLNEAIDPDNSLHVVRERGIEFCLKKKEESFWPRLTKSTQKKHWLKIDFSKWQDEDDDEEDEGIGGGMGGMGGMPGMGGMGGMGGFGGGDMDFEKMMKEMGGLGGGGLGGGPPGMDDLDNDNNQESDSDDDCALPELE